MRATTAPRAGQLNPAIAAWLAQVRTVPVSQTTPAQLRAAMAAMNRIHVPAGPALPWVQDALVPSDQGPAVPVRVYDPAPSRAKPVCLYFHGGGHMTGSVEVYDPICRRLAAASGALVLSVDYRLAPEHPYPAGLDDARAVLAGHRALLAQLGRQALACTVLAGDSGGAALAATLTAESVVQGTPVAGQMLVYPSLDYLLEQPSVARLGQGYLLEAERVRWYFDHYFPVGADRRAASPLHALPAQPLPPTLLLTAGFCPLRDEALVYRDRLRAQGTVCRHLDFGHEIHGYLNLEQLAPQACARSYAAMARFLAVQP